MGKECKKFGITLNDIDDDEMNGNKTFDINPCLLKRAKRATQISKSSHDSIVLSTLGKQGRIKSAKESLISNVSQDTDKMRHCLFEVIDYMCAELDRRFANNEKLLLICDTLKPDSQLFLNINQMTIVSQNYPSLGIKDDKLLAEVAVAREMLLKKDDIC